MRARPYQNCFIDAVLRQFEDVASTLGVMATGLGKTFCFATLAKRWARGRVLILAHREELIQQAADTVRRVTGEPPDVEMADLRADAKGLLDPSRVVVASVPSLCRPNRLKRFRPDEFGLVVCDEAHHAVGSSYRTIFDHFRRNESLKVLGVTATPKRLDKLAMGMVFDSVAYEYGIESASEDGWLVKVLQQRVIVDGLDFSKVRQTAGDMNERDLEEVLKQEKILHAIAAPTVKLAGDRPTLVFCVTVEHARLLCDVFNRYKPQSAAWVSGDTDRQDRRDIVAAYKAGRIQFLLNCGVFLEGFDAPHTSLICMARPTNSLALYVQVIGRATRTLPGVLDGLDEATPAERKAAIAASAKPDMLILDFKGNAGRHKIVTADDILGGKYALPVKQYARETLEREGRAAAVEDSLGRAEKELSLLAEEKELASRRAKVKAEAEFRTQRVGLFGGSAAKRQDGKTPEERQFKGELASAKQIGYLVHLGVPYATAAGYTKRQAGAVIDSLVKKRKGPEGVNG